MHMFVTFEAFDTIINTADVIRLREAVAGRVQVMKKSGKFVAGGIFTDGRHGYIILDVSAPADLWALLGGEMLDRCHIVTHPVASFEELGEFFKAHPPA